MTLSLLTTIDATHVNPDSALINNMDRWFADMRRMGHFVLVTSAFHASPDGQHFILHTEARFVDPKAAAWFKLVFA